MIQDTRRAPRRQPTDLLPVTVGHTALGATLAAYEQWLRTAGARLDVLLDTALGELAGGFPALAAS